MAYNITNFSNKVFDLLKQKHADCWQASFSSAIFFTLVQQSKSLDHLVCRTCNCLVLDPILVEGCECVNSVPSAVCHECKDCKTCGTKRNLIPVSDDYTRKMQSYYESFQVECGCDEKVVIGPGFKTLVDHYSTQHGFLCGWENCEQTIPLSRYKEHHLQCREKPISCAYGRLIKDLNLQNAPFPCNFVGNKTMMLKHNETTKHDQFAQVLRFGLDVKQDLQPRFDCNDEKLDALIPKEEEEVKSDLNLEKVKKMVRFSKKNELKVIKEESDDDEPLLSMFYVGNVIDVKNYDGTWSEAKIVQVKQDEVEVQFLERDSSCNVLIAKDSKDVAKRNTHTVPKDLGMFYVGNVIDVKDIYDVWAEAKILKVDQDHIRVHFIEWKSKLDEWVRKDSDCVAKRNTHTVSSSSSDDDVVIIDQKSHVVENKGLHLHAVEVYKPKMISRMVVVSSEPVNYSTVPENWWIDRKVGDKIDAMHGSKWDRATILNINEKDGIGFTFRYVESAKLPDETVIARSPRLAPVGTYTTPSSGWIIRMHNRIQPNAKGTFINCPDVFKPFESINKNNIKQNVPVLSHNVSVTIPDVHNASRSWISYDHVTVDRFREWLVVTVGMDWKKNPEITSYLKWLEEKFYPYAVSFEAEKVAPKRKLKPEFKMSYCFVCGFYSFNVLCRSCDVPLCMNHIANNTLCLCSKNCDSSNNNEPSSKLQKTSV